MRGLKLNRFLSFRSYDASHLLQMRGLKQIYQSQINGDFGVASFTDAWIETTGEGVAFEKIESHLLQMRGLKLNRDSCFQIHNLSHLLQMRGLKPVPVTSLAVTLCRIFYRCVD